MECLRYQCPFSDIGWNVYVTTVPIYYLGWKVLRYLDIRQNFLHYSLYFTLREIRSLRKNSVEERRLKQAFGELDKQSFFGALEFRNKVQEVSLVAT